MSSDGSSRFQVESEKKIKLNDLNFFVKRHTLLSSSLGLQTRSLRVTQPFYSINFVVLIGDDIDPGQVVDIVIVIYEPMT